MTVQTRAMIDKALALDSNEITALMLLASDAFMSANYAHAIELRQKVMDPNSPGTNLTKSAESIKIAKLLPP
ncbi:heme lyase subunit NrfG [Escherichia coli]|nr:heme lyase subunit NrfG [Escherichia coli]